MRDLPDDFRTFNARSDGYENLDGSWTESGCQGFRTDWLYDPSFGEVPGDMVGYFGALIPDIDGYDENICAYFWLSRDVYGKRVDNDNVHRLGTGEYSSEYSSRCVTAAPFFFMSNEDGVWPFSIQMLSFYYQYRVVSQGNWLIWPMQSRHYMFIERTNQWDSWEDLRDLERLGWEIPG